MRSAPTRRLAAVLLTGLVGVGAHALLGNVDWAAAIALVVGGAGGLVGGTRLLAKASAASLHRWLLLFLYLTAAAMVARGLMPGAPRG